MREDAMPGEPGSGASDGAATDAGTEAGSAGGAVEAGAGAGSASAADGGPDDGYEAPIGTLFLLMVYVMVLAGMWVTMYWLLVSR